MRAIGCVSAAATVSAVTCLARLSSPGHLFNCSSEAFQKGGRKGAKRVMIVITDGESHDSPDLEKVIEDSEKDNVTRYAVAVSGGGPFRQQTAAKAMQRSAVPCVPQCNGPGSAAHLHHSRCFCRGLCCWSCFCRRWWDAQFWIQLPEQVLRLGISRTLRCTGHPNCMRGAQPGLPGGITVAPCFSVCSHNGVSDAKAVGLLPYGYPSGALGRLSPSLENPSLAFLF